jgi:hypothetical protein
VSSITKCRTCVTNQNEYYKKFEDTLYQINVTQVVLSCKVDKKEIKLEKRLKLLHYQAMEI